MGHKVVLLIGDVEHRGCGFEMSLADIETSTDVYIHLCKAGDASTSTMLVSCPTFRHSINSGSYISPRILPSQGSGEGIDRSVCNLVVVVWRLRIASVLCLLQSVVG